MADDFSESAKLHELAVMANTQANEFARTGLANIILLNGGAILAFGPIGSLFVVKIGTVWCSAFFSLASFAVGMLAAAGAFMIGFFVNSRLSDLMWSRINQEGAQKDAELVNSHNSMRAWGIRLAFTGILGFIVGSIFGGIALYNGAS